jgi:hypothetical protein
VWPPVRTKRIDDFPSAPECTFGSVDTDLYVGTLLDLHDICPNCPDC